MLYFISVLLMLVCLSILCVLISNNVIFIFKKDSPEEIVSNKEPEKRKVEKKVKYDHRLPFLNKHSHVFRHNSLSSRFTGHA